MTPRSRGAMVVCAMVVIGLVPYASGGSITVSFDEPQIVNNDPLLNFYNGGKTFRGIGPGPDYRIAFTINARVFTQTSGLTGTFTSPGIAELYSDTAREGEGIAFTMDVYPGMSGSLSFDFATIDAGGELKFYSGLDRTGTLLADVTLPVTSPITGPGVFVSDSVSFPGVVHSIVFSGGNKQLAIDDLSLATVPEPTSWILLVLGGLMSLAAPLARSRAPRRRPSSPT
jgi:hypothetical protein